MPGVVETTNTFATNDVITSTAMNNIIDQTLFTSDAIVSANTTLALVSGKLKVGTITSNEMGTNAVTTTAILDGSITPAKLSNSDFGDFTVVTGVATLDSNVVTTAKILDANVTPAKLSQPLTLATAQNSTSGTSIDFTSIPSWVKRITVMLQGVSTSGTSVIVIQLGDSGGIENTGYIAHSGVIQNSSVGSSDYTTGFGIADANAAAHSHSGSIIFSLLENSTNSWVANGSVRQASNIIAIVAGSKSLSGVLDRVRITTVNGTDTFDAGKINIIYE